MSRLATLLSLGAVVLVVGVASLVVTGAINRARSAPQATPTLLTAPSPTAPLPTPASCTPDQLTLDGVFNDCAVPVVTTSSCRVSSHGVLDVVMQLRGVGGGTPHDYLLYLHIGAGYHGPGTYADSSVSVAVREYATGAFWQSTGGVLRVSSPDGRSGSVKADVAYVGGEPTPPTVGLNVSGPWRCV
jgi:hypothetical protein